MQEQTFWLCKSIVEVAVRVAALRPSLSEHAGCGGPWLMWLHISVGCTAQFSEMPLETVYGREMNILFTSNSYGGLSCCQHANSTHPQNLQHHAGEQTAHLRVAFYHGQLKAHLCHSFHVVMDYLVKGELLTNTVLDRFVNDI